MILFFKEKEEEAADAEPVNIPPIWRILKLNLTEWPYMVVGIICAAISGAMPVVFAVILSEVLEVGFYVINLFNVFYLKDQCYLESSLRNL